jgi:NitT/TauT family transport system substrate-binding protein
MKKIQLLIAMLCTMALSVSVAADVPTVRVSLFSWPGYGFWYIAKEKNLAPGINLDIQIIEDPYESFGQMTAGRIDISSSTSEYGPIAADADNGIKLVACTNPSTGTDKIILAPSMNSAEDLKGKSVAVLEGGLTQIFMALWLEKNGVKFDEVNYVNVIMDDAVAAMVSGKVAAAEFWEPFGGTVLEALKGSKVMATSAEEEWLSTGLLGDAIYMSDAFIEKKPEVAKLAMKAYWDAVAWWRENPAEGNKIIAEAIKFDVKDVEDVIGTEAKEMSAGIFCFNMEEAAQFMGLMEGAPPLGLKNGQIHEHWAITSKWWLKFGFTKKEHPIEAGISFEPFKSLIASE